MHELISQRWSPRGFDADATLSDDDLLKILDAGRWAATWGAVQPVRFLGDVRGTPTFDRLAATLAAGNASWAPRASALILVCTTDSPEDPKRHDYGVFDAGLAVAQMTIQAVASGLATHPMAGFDTAAAAAEFAVPPEFRPIALMAIGTIADDPSTLPEDIRERDERPRTRLPLQEVAFTDRWGTPLRP